MKIKLLHIFLILNLFFPIWLFSKDKQIDYSKMKRDLDIMKVILDRIMKPEQMSGVLMTENTRAIFLEGNGIIFIYEHSFGDRLLFLKESDGNFVLDSYLQTVNAMNARKQNLAETSGIKDAKLTEIRKNIEEEQQKIKSHVVEFFGDYCDAIKQLEADDKISVVVMPGQSNYHTVGRLIGKNEIEFPTMVASVRRSDIQAFRRESLSYEAFQKRIRFINTEKNQDRMEKDIQIMTTIFDTALKQNSNNKTVLPGETRGLYLEDFGALFTVKALNTFSMEMFFYSSDNNKVFTFSDDAHRGNSKTKNQIDRLKSNLIRLLADYGHTMHSLKSNEWIGIVLETSYPGASREGPSTIFMKVRKKDTEALNQRKIRFNEFKKRIIIKEY